MSNPRLKIENQLCFSLYRLSKFVTQKYQVFLSQVDLTYPQYLVFLVLSDRGALSVKSLGEILSLDSGTLSPLLKRLEDKGFVQKKKCNKDERSIKVELTEKANSIMQQAEEIPQQMICDLPWQEKDLKSLKDSLDRLYLDWENCKQKGRC